MTAQTLPVVARLCGTRHTLAPGASEACHCGRVVLALEYTPGENAIRPWVDENGVEYPAAFDAPQIVGWKIKRGKK